MTPHGPGCHVHFRPDVGQRALHRAEPGVSGREVIKPRRSRDPGNADLCWVGSLSLVRMTVVIPRLKSLKHRVLP